MRSVRSRDRWGVTAAPQSQSKTRCATPPAIATLLGRESESRLRGALRTYDIVSARSAADLIAIVRATSPSFVVTEPWDGTGTPVAPVVHRLKVMLPSVPVIVYAKPNGALYHEILPLARAGIDAIILRDVDDQPSVLRACVERARYGCLETEVLTAIGALIPPDAVLFIRYCLQRAERVSVERAAATLAMDRKTLLNRLARHRLPPPREMAAWCRLLVAARLLEDPARSAEQVGLLVGCGSATALRNLFLRYTGQRPSAIRASGGMQTVLRLFTTVLRGESSSSGIGEQT